MKNKAWYPFIASILLGVGILLGYSIRGGQNKAGYGSSVFDQVIQIIKAKYVENVDEKFQEQSINELLSNLDPHSVYIPKEDLTAADEELMGNFEGIGIEFQIIDDTIQVMMPIQGGPSASLGILTGDKIIKIDDKNVAGIGITNMDVMKGLKGPAGTMVKVTIKRAGSNNLVFNIKRDRIPIYSVPVGLMLDKNTAYVKVNSFSATTHQEFVIKLDSLMRKGAKSLIIDLRQNGGGFLEQAVAIVDEVLDGNRLVVYTEGNNSLRKDYKSKRPGIFESGKVIVLIDEGSASASEIVSGAIQDWDRGMLIGRRTFGKGLVQEPFLLSDGSSLRLTIAKYYTPSGRCIQKPYLDYEQDMMNRYNSGELFAAKDTTKHKKTEVFYTKINKRKVYSNGGITPDIIVPMDTTSITPLVIEVYAKNLLNQYVLSYYQKNKANFEAYKNVMDYKQSFDWTTADYDNFLSYCIQNNIDKTKLTFKESSYKEIKSRVKALIAKQLYGNDGYYIMVLDDDMIIKKALQQL